MAFDPGETFRLMQCAYRTGLMDKMVALQGEEMAEVLSVTGLNFSDLFNRMDETSQEEVTKADKKLERLGPQSKDAWNPDSAYSPPHASY